jgi:hypothetical protein
VQRGCREVRAVASKHNPRSAVLGSGIWRLGFQIV